jgi:hypothetical protein
MIIEARDQVWVPFRREFMKHAQLKFNWPRRIPPRILFWWWDKLMRNYLLVCARKSAIPASDPTAAI